MGPHGTGAFANDAGTFFEALHEVLEEVEGEYGKLYDEIVMSGLDDSEPVGGLV